MHYDDRPLESTEERRARPDSGRCCRCGTEYKTAGDRIDHEDDRDRIACFAALLGRIADLEAHVAVDDDSGPIEHGWGTDGWLAQEESGQYDTRLADLLDPDHD